MRASILFLPIALTTLASTPIAAQEAPRVIFCTGQCTAVDAKGLRTPAPKGTQLRENQGFATGPGAYAQLKVGRSVALGVGERAQLRFDQKSIRGRDVVILDQGRIRMLDGATIGKPGPRTLELRTTDGNFALQGADIEVKTPPRGGSSASSLTFVKLNVGDARLLNPQGEIAIAKDGVQGFTGGKVITDRSISPAEVAMTPARASTLTTPRIDEPVKNLPAASLPVQAPIVRPDVLLLGGSLLSGTSLRQAIPAPILAPVTKADFITTTPYTNPATGKPGTIAQILTAPSLAPSIASGALTTVILAPVKTSPVPTAPASTILPSTTILTPLLPSITLVPILPRLGL
jgi:hypothetical protein